MRPLYLVFENTDELGDLVRIIFKNGDGKYKTNYTTYSLWCIRTYENCGFFRREGRVVKTFLRHNNNNT